MSEENTPNIIGPGDLKLIHWIIILGLLATFITILLTGFVFTVGTEHPTAGCLFIAVTCVSLATLGLKSWADTSEIKELKSCLKDALERLEELERTQETPSHPTET
jgi:uncharacterized membrane protein (DUF106 family)